MKKEKAKRIAKRITAFAAAVAMAAAFTFPAEVGDGFFDGFGNAIVASAADYDREFNIADGNVTIDLDGTYRIYSNDHNTSVTNTITVAAGVSANITLDNVNIDVSRIDNACAFKIADDSGGNVKITLADGSVNTLKSGENCAGLQKNGGTGKLTIQGGTNGTGKLTAESSFGGAGIGSGKYDDGVNITITGGDITAVGVGGAGIGGSINYSGKNITITGGTVTARSSAYGAGIGGGGDNGSGSDIKISGGTVRAFGSLGGAGIGGSNLGTGSNIIISGGTVTAQGGSSGGAGIGGGVDNTGSNIVISGGSVDAKGGRNEVDNCSGADIGNGASLGYSQCTDGTSITPTNGDSEKVYLAELSAASSSLTIDGKEYPINHGDGKVYAYLTEGMHTIVSDGVSSTILCTKNGKVSIGLNVTATDGGTLTYGDDYTYEGGVLTIKSDKAITIANARTGATSDRIEVASGVSANITLAGVDIDVSSSYGTAAFKIADNSTGNVTVNLVGENTLKSGNERAGLQKNGYYGSLKIEGTGKLTAIGGESGAGIGGGYGGNGYYITIKGGIISATGTFAAGIGGGATGDIGGTNGFGKYITIEGGTVTASGGSFGVGIGSGEGANPGIANDSEIVIKGGSVNASSFNGTPTNGTDNVYLREIANDSGADIQINNNSYPTNHNGEKKIYAYLPAKSRSTPNEVKVGSTTTYCYYDTTNSKWINVIDDVTISIDKPTAGDTLATSATVISPSTGVEAITSSDIVWKDASDSVVSGTAGYNKEYTVYVTLKASSGYAFKTDVGATVNTTGTADFSENNGDTITVKYTFAATARGTLTAADFEFTKPSNLVYDGNAKTATVTAKTGITGIGEITVKYQKTGETTATTEAPKTPGTYKVSIDVAAGDNYAAVTGLTADAWEFTITKATPIVPVPPASTAVEYGKTLADAGLTEGWTWEDGNSTVPQPANTYTAYKELTDDGNYDYSGLSVSGFTYDEDDHKLSYEVPVTVNPATPTITVTASPSSAITGKATTVTLTSEVKNPNNDSLNDCPSPEFFYKIGNGPEQDITNGSFVIPADTPNGTTFTISARTPGTANYIAGTGTTTILVSNCTHPDVSDAWETDETYHWHECTDCGAELYKAEHSSNAPATETSPEVCKDCGYEMSPATGHIHKNHLTFVDKIEPADCTTDGTEAHYECDCGKLFADDQAATEVTLESLKIAAHHSYGTEWVSDNDDNHYHVCSVCGDKTDITDHSYDNGVITTPATEQTTGIKTYTCSECNHTKTEIVPKLNHTHSLATDYSSDATGHWYACSGCTEKVDFEAHTEDSGTVTTEPTETTEGVKTFKCVKCEYVMRTETIPPITPEHTHEYSTEWKSDSTSHWHECACGEKADIAAHISDNGVVTLQPTETSEGIMTYSCTVCDYILRTETIPAIVPEHTHEYGTEWKSDSSTHWHECSCGEKTDIAQHISNGGIVTVQPTATSTGLRVYSCSICGYVLRTETIPATGNIYPSYPTYPTYPFDSSIFNVVSFTDKLNVTAETTGNTVTLKWDKVEKADKYYVYQYKNGKYVKIKTTSDTSVTLKGLKNGETYKFLVRYTINGRLSPTAYSSKFTVKVYYKPLPKATATKNSVKLTWDAVPEAEKYAIYKYVDGKAVKLAEIKGTSVKISKLLPNTEYSYIVSAFVDGEWTKMYKSDIVTVKTKAE